MSHTHVGRPLGVYRAWLPSQSPHYSATGGAEPQVVTESRIRGEVCDKGARRARPECPAFGGKFEPTVGGYLRTPKPSGASGALSHRDRRPSLLRHSGKRPHENRSRGSRIPGNSFISEQGVPPHVSPPFSRVSPPPSQESGPRLSNQPHDSRTITAARPALAPPPASMHTDELPAADGDQPASPGEDCAIARTPPNRDLRSRTAPQAGPRSLDAG